MGKEMREVIVRFILCKKSPDQMKIWVGEGWLLWEVSSTLIEYHLTRVKRETRIDSHFMKNLLAFRVGESEWESMRAYESFLPNDSECWNSPSLRTLPGARVGNTVNSRLADTPLLRTLDITDKIQIPIYRGLTENDSRYYGPPPFRTQNEGALYSESWLYIFI